MGKHSLKRLYASSPRLHVDNGSKIVLMSDAHRGDGTQSDDIMQNKTIVSHALAHYLNEGFTYIELGDGDDLWKNKKMSNIEKNHADIFALLMMFKDNNKLHLVYGNHDFDKKTSGSMAPAKSLDGEFVPGFSYEESLVLSFGENRNMLLLHGHQVDWINYDLWPLSRFFVRHIWRPLQLLGVKNPFIPAENTKKADRLDKLLMEWSESSGIAIAAGHTHRSMFPNPGGPLYFNDGCCVHPYGITAIEIERGQISLVRWLVATRHDASLYVARAVDQGSININRMFSKRTVSNGV
ncbi:MAG: metallophosphoesterase family protein [Eubacteriaceae bacterium]|nr:metallophosphoesterase family protein [Eubacteriaceae bacterium]